MPIQKVVFFVVLSSCALWIGVRCLNLYTRPSHVLGVRNGQLADCPDLPNCVSTQATRAEHRVEPIPLTGTPESAIQHVEAILKSLPRSRIISSQRDYLHAEFRSMILGFVDDVEIAIDEQAALIHFRSASRVGRSDLGANRRRLEGIRERLVKLGL